MRAIYSPAKGGAWVLTAIMVATAACHPNRSSSPGLDRRLTEASLTVERDSLVMEVAATGKLLQDIRDELDRVPPVSVAVTAGESHAPESSADMRRLTLDRVRATATRLKAAEARLAGTERRLAKITTVRDSLSKGLAQSQLDIVALTAAVAEQQGLVTDLTARLEGFEAENTSLVERVYQLTDAQNTAYYVVGTRKELVARGILVEDGPRAIPLVGRRGVSPARDLPLAEFTSIDRSNVLELPLPKADHRYRIVSRQNTAHLVRAEQDGNVRGAIQIASPEGFWEGSKYLIVVEQ
jgi:hypothetical protein